MRSFPYVADFDANKKKNTKNYSKTLWTDMLSILKFKYFTFLNSYN